MERREIHESVLYPAPITRAFRRLAIISGSGLCFFRGWARVKFVYCTYYQISSDVDCGAHQELAWNSSSILAKTASCMCAGKGVYIAQQQKPKIDTDIKDQASGQ